jgi:uncharacterized membrane protein YdjX (TVP38/TMEM64 family)
MKPKTIKKLLILIALVLTFFVIQKYEISGYFTLENLKIQKAKIDELYLAKPFLVIGVYFLLYMGAAAINIPPALLMSLCSGAFFGLFTGTILNAVASTFAATFVFLTGRYLIHDTMEVRLQKRFGNKIKVASDGIKKEGATYLLFLRMTPLLPYFMTNLLMSLTPVSTKTFILVTMLGMLPGEIAYVNAGTKIMEVNSLRDVLSFDLLLSLGIIGILPFIMKFILKWWRNKKLKETQ